MPPSGTRLNSTWGTEEELNDAATAKVQHAIGTQTNGSRDKAKRLRRSSLDLTVLPSGFCEASTNLPDSAFYVRVAFEALAD